MVNHVLVRGERKLEVWQYGDPSGDPVFFFHGLIGSHHQASYIAEEAKQHGLRIIAPNRPGVGKSEFTVRRRAEEWVSDVEDVAAALGLDEFSVIGISGGAPYALAVLHRLGTRVKTATLLSGMGPLRLPGALRGMRRSDRIGLEIGTRSPALAMREFRRWQASVQADPHRFLAAFIAQLIPADRRLFREGKLYDLFLQDLVQVFVEGQGPEGLAQELVVFRNFAIPFGELPRERRVALWHGLDDDLVPPAMAWALSQRIPNSEAHFVPGGHFVAVEIADQIIARLREVIDQAASPPKEPTVSPGREKGESL
jgi:pimeloyl-ACP methyl ester carboxylesterase